MIALFDFVQSREVFLVVSALKPKLDIGLCIDLAEFPCIPKFLHDVIIKLFCFDLQMTTCKNWVIQGNSGKFREIQGNSGKFREI